MVKISCQDWQRATGGQILFLVPTVKSVKVTAVYVRFAFSETVIL